MPIRQLSPETINRIAAGEVVERPASVVKELVENALDAGAGEVEVVTASGGLSLIRVTDDGSGMAPDDLVLAVERHATSKLSEEDLFAIRTLGFRGEALPSIGSIASLTILSRARGAAEAFALSVDRGAKGKVKPAAGNVGTCVEVRDLFSSVPARLKFLKSERAENQAVSEVVKRLARYRVGRPSFSASRRRTSRRSRCPKDRPTSASCYSRTCCRPPGRPLSTRPCRRAGAYGVRARSDREMGHASRSARLSRDRRRSRIRAAGDRRHHGIEAIDLASTRTSSPKSSARGPTVAGPTP